MRDLSELTALLDTTIPLCTQDDIPAEAEALELLDMLRRHPTVDGATAAAHFGLDGASVEFGALKDRLKFKFLDAVTSLEHPGLEAHRRDREFSYVWKVIAVGKQLRKRGGSDVLLPYLEDAYRRAEEFEFVEAAYLCAVMLRRQYTNRYYDADKYQYYRERSALYRRVVRDYHDIVTAINDIFYLRNARAPTQEIRQLAEESLARHAHCVADYDITMVSYLVFLLEVNLYLVEDEYADVIRVSTAALEYLEARPQSLPTMYQVFEANLAVAYAQLNDYRNGITFARRMLSKTTTGEHNYFKVYELMLILALRAGKFHRAYEIYHSIDKEALESNMASYYRETFRIIEAYLYLLVEMGQIKPAVGDTTFCRFRIKRFLNSFEHAPQEKGHRNVHLLIIQLVDDIVQRRHQQSALSIEAVGKYVQRYLKGKGYERIRYFLKALARLSEQGFQRAAVERHTAKYVRAIARYPLEESKLEYYMELIPYDLLWKLLVEQLGYKRIKLRRGKS